MRAPFDRLRGRALALGAIVRRAIGGAASRRATKLGLILALSAGAPALIAAVDDPIVADFVVATDPTAGDADDPALWIHPDDPRLSRIIGTDKGAGIFVFDLAGRLVQQLGQGTRVNNVDVRQDVTWGSGTADIVAWNLRAAGKLGVAVVDDSGELTQIAGADSTGNDIQVDSYGFALYRDPRDGVLYVFERPKNGGQIRQYRIEPDGSGGVGVTPVRTLIYGGDTAEGFVADDLYGVLYVAEEACCIHKYLAPPDADPAAIGRFAEGDGIRSDREGLALYGTEGGGGYLLLSSQGNSTVKVYDRLGGNAFVTTIDTRGTLGTDGIDATGAALPGLPQGLLVAHDENDSRFEVFDWRDMIAGGLAGARLEQAPPPEPDPPTHGGGETEPGLLVAFIGDSGFGAGAQQVWRLIRDEGADMVLHQGDLAYAAEDDASARQWRDTWQGILGADFPYFYSIGNHDSDAWDSSYQPFLEETIDLVGADCTPFDSSANAACTYRGLFFVLSGAGERGSEAGNTAFIESALAGNDALWSVCSWHHNQREMQIGGKSSDVGWGPYEACRRLGALVATGHEHSYSRTHTLVGFEDQRVDPDFPERDRLRVAEGATFAFVSGLGGKDVRDQERCLPDGFPYGCNGEWASIYSENQGAQSGALFIRFHVDGDPHKARGYFKNVAGEVVDAFEVVSELSMPEAEPPPDASARDLALVDLKPPRQIRLSDRRPAVRQRVRVALQNRGPETETIPDLAALEALVALEVLSLGSCPAPVLELRSRGQLRLTYEVTFDCANDPARSTRRDPGHSDFEFRAHIALDDDHPEDNACPRSVSPPFEIDPFPNGRIRDKGCGARKADRTRGGPLETDVSRKP
jgi:myo-inositol-hexaphosphate 3-phosphohydrolase